MKQCGHLRSTSKNAPDFPSYPFQSSPPILSRISFPFLSLLLFLYLSPFGPTERYEIENKYSRRTFLRLLILSAPNVLPSPRSDFSILFFFFSFLFFFASFSNFLHFLFPLLLLLHYLLLFISLLQLVHILFLRKLSFFFILYLVLIYLLFFSPSKFFFFPIYTSTSTSPVFTH